MRPEKNTQERNTAKNENYAKARRGK